MKYIVILGDGMADEPIDALGGKTPLACAETPVMDELASKGEMGMVQNVPAGMAPGSDVANLSVLGYNPAVCYSGRSPLEALSVGVAMEPTDIVLRCNIVTLTEEEPYAKKTILDHSSSEISTADADILMDAIMGANESPLKRALLDAGIALWDVCGECEREGSLDSNICHEKPNRIDELLRSYPSIRAIAFNGQGAARLYRKHFGPLASEYGPLILPSTSPAHAVAFDKKLDGWMRLRDLLVPADEASRP